MHNSGLSEALLYLSALVFAGAAVSGFFYPDPNVYPRRTGLLALGLLCYVVSIIMR